MTTLRPHIIRADTLDLQDHDAPSASDHSHQPEHPSPLGAGPPAPHQEDALRHMSEDRHAEQEHLADAWGSGRSSHEGSELLNDDASNSTDETRLDDSSIQQNGTATDKEEGEENLEDDIMDDRSSSPSIEEDEIDYDFVYALHNFVATVEGQANATKGDHMVLLDDTNSYWWLVRVVKDSSIGYLPAEHIETPNERLARLYKHRNIHATQSALEDFQPKSKNPLKKAMRRRNAKTVQFTAPTFYEPEDIDWSDVEGDSDREDESQTTETGEKQASQQNDDEEIVDGETSQTNGQTTAEQADEPGDAENAKPLATEETRSALDSSRPEQDSLEQQQETTPSRSRNGTMRNTDSFFKDDTAEPRKISLTPNLLREENADGSVRSSGSTEKPPSAQEVLEQMDNGAFTTDKLKEDKKKKDKKSGMLSGLFKRKDKKIKVDEAAGGVAVKHEVDSGSPILTPGDSGSPTGSNSPAQRPGSSGMPVVNPPAPVNIPTKGLPSSAIVSAPASKQTPAQPETATAGERSIATESSTVTEDSQNAEQKPLTIDTSVGPRSQTGESQSKSLFPSNSDSKREKLKKAKQRIDLDVESSPEEPPATNPLVSGLSREAEESKQSEQEYQAVSPVDRSLDSSTTRPNLALNTLTQPSTLSRESDSPPTPFDTTDSAEATPDQHLASSMASSVHTAAESLSTPSESSSPVSATTPPATEPADQSWNDAALSAYLKERSNADVKDMLIRVHDKTGVVPLPLDHPKMLGLGFYESQKRLDEMSSQLDGLLNGFLARSAARPKSQQK